MSSKWTSCSERGSAFERLRHAARVAAIAAIALVVAGCRCSDEAAVVPDTVPIPEVADASLASPPPVGGAEAFRFPAAPRVVAIGDLHADFEGTLRAFRLAGAIDGGEQWIGGPLVVVQTGDQLDRGPDGRRILDFLEDLTAQARRAGGAVHVLNGNHETMNVALDFRYVTPEGFRTFDDFANGPAPPGVPVDWRGRAVAFLPGGPYATKLAERRVVVVVGDTAFVHGGVLTKHVEYGIDRINAEVSAWMRGERPGPPPLSVTTDDGPVWTRVYGDAEPLACAAAEPVLAALVVRRIVVGHTVQRTGITSVCDGRVWRIDVGIARHYGSRVEVLELTGAGAKTLRE